MLMILDAIFGFFQAGWSALLNAIPVPESPGWWSTSMSAVAWLITNVAKLGNWVPLSMIGSIITFIFTMWLTAGGIVIVRMGVSLFSGGGGTVHTT